MQEDQNTEFKSEYSDTLIKTVIAFSNGIGGRILVGVDDDGNIIGLNDPDETCKRCDQALRDKIRPDVTRTTHIGITILENKPVVEISVLDGPLKPYYLRDRGLRPEGVYIRRGTTSIPATDDIFYHLTHEYISTTYEELASFKQNLTFKYLSSLMKQKNLVFDKDHMEALHMVHNGMFTNLAFILSDQFDQTIKMAVFSDDTMSRFLDRDIAEGSILKQAEHAARFIMNHNRLSSRIIGLYREDMLAYPEVAVREAVLNAVVHRDYSNGSTPILIRMFPDRLEITSPGCLIVNYTDEDLFRGVSSLRNKYLADLMYRLELIEAYGTGLPKIMRSYDDSEKKPAVTTSVSTFTITLPAKDAIPDSTERILTPGRIFTRQEIQDELGINRNAAVSLMKDLIREGKIIRIGDGRSTRYRVI